MSISPPEGHIIVKVIVSPQTLTELELKAKTMFIPTIEEAARDVLATWAANH